MRPLFSCAFLATLPTAKHGFQTRQLAIHRPKARSFFLNYVKELSHPYRKHLPDQSTEMRLLSSLFASILTILFTQSVCAQSQHSGKMSFEFKGQSAVTGDPARPSSDGARVLIEYDGVLTMGTLLGEPVIMVRMKYKLLGGSVTIPTFEPGESPYETIDLEQIPTKARSLVDLYGFKMAFHFTTAGPERVLVIEDGGAVMKAEQYSFNLPGSPDWDEVFVTSLGDFTDKGVEFMSAEEAFQIWKGGLNLFDVEVHDVKLTMHDLHMWWAENNERPRYRATLRALKRVQEGIGLAYGFLTAANEVLGVSPTLQESYGAFARGDTDRTSFGGELYGLSDRDDYLPEYARAADLAEEALRKLQFLPESIKQGDNHLPYYTAVGQANEIIGQVAEWRRTYKSEDVDPDTLPVGVEQDFDDAVKQFKKFHVSSRYEGGERSGWIIDPANGNRPIRRMDYNEALIWGKVIVRTGLAYRCERGLAKIPYFEPASGAEIGTIRVECTNKEILFASFRSTNAASHGFAEAGLEPTEYERADGFGDLVLQSIKPCMGKSSRGYHQFHLQYHEVNSDLLSLRATPNLLLEDGYNTVSKNC
ncbi:hypothetical protein [Pseudophaeobacter sp.]|uniref:hypothetical protein n=1 Tax=Pseudophaeobacter sp. TaxID=1971739 RepID=UPI0026109C3E|nr:hypothetical protein [Pseudophaeobacter sp.]